MKTNDLHVVTIGAAFPGESVCFANVVAQKPRIYLGEADPFEVSAG